MQRQDVIRAVLFVLFFSIGAASLSGSILLDDLVRYYQNKHYLAQAQESLVILENLNEDYDALFEQLKADPNAIKRIAPAALGTEPNEADTIYPRVTAEQLVAAKEALAEQSEAVEGPAMPRWVIRCSKQPRRTVLFLAGGFLILISFIWFGPAERKRFGS